jgi:recombination protein RecA
MVTPTALRAQIEAALAKKVPAALTPKPRIVYPLLPTNIAEVDELLGGGLPEGAISEIVGPESSGRTALALACVAGATQAGKVCAWVDVSDTLHPESAAGIGVDLSRMLWIRCGSKRTEYESAPAARQQEIVFPEKYARPQVATKGLHGGGYGPHPRTEGKGLSSAVENLLGAGALAAPQAISNRYRGSKSSQPPREHAHKKTSARAQKPWQRLEQALRAVDLLLQSGGFASIVFDMGSIAPEHASRIPLATWFRIRSAAERMQICFLLLEQSPCAKNSAALVLRLEGSRELAGSPTLFTGTEHRLELAQRRFSQAQVRVLPLRKPVQSVRTASWQAKALWAGRR